MIFKKVQEGCKIRRINGIFGYNRSVSCLFSLALEFPPAFEAHRSQQPPTHPRGRHLSDARAPTEAIPLQLREHQLVCE